MSLNSSITELTTAATDAGVAVLSMFLLARLRGLNIDARWSKAVWSWVFVLLSTASLLGAVAHGFQWSASARAAIWQPLYLSLGLSVALFLVGGIGDWRGEAAARRALPWALGLGLAFFLVTRWLSDGFGVFIAFEGVAMISTLAMYIHMWLRGRSGAGMVAVGIVLTLLASAIQATSLRSTVIVPLDHNGLYHVVQAIAVVVVASGVRAGLVASTAKSVASATH